MMTTRLVAALLLFLPLGFIQAQETTYTIADTARARVLFEEAKELKAVHKFDVAIEKIEQTKSIYTNLEGHYDLEVGRCFFELGLLHMEKGQYDTALGLYDTAVTLIKTRIGHKTLELANIYNETGVVYYYLGNFEKSMHLFKSTLDIRIIKLGQSHPDVLSTYSNIGLINKKIGKYKESEDYYNEAINMASKKLTNDSKKALLGVYANLGNLYRDLQQPEKALRCDKKALELNKEISSIKTLDMRYYNLACTYYDLSNYKNAKFYGNEAIRLRENEQIANDFRIGKYYSLLGSIYAVQLKNEKAVLYKEKALNLMQLAPRKDYTTMVYIYNDLGVINKRQGNIVKAVDYHKKALQVIRDKLDGQNHMLMITYLNLGGIYLKTNPDKAYLYTQKGIKAYENNAVRGKHTYGKLLGNLGLINFEKGDFNESLTNFEKSLQILEEKYGKNHPELAKRLISIGNIYSAKRQWEESIKYYEFAFKCLHKKNNLHVDEHYLKDFFESLSLVNTCHNRLYYQDRNIEELYKSKYRLYTGIKMSQSINHFSSKLKPLSYFFFQLYRDAIQTDYLLMQAVDSIHYSKSCFSYSEKAKANQLTSSIKDTDALTFSELPQEILEKEYDLRVDISYYDKKRNRLISNGINPTDTTTLELSSKLVDLTNEYEALKSQLERDYPDYYNLKYNFSTISVEEVQNNLLTEKETLLEYFVADSSIYIFIINKDSFHIKEMKKDFPLEAWVSDFRKANDSKFYRQLAVKYTESAHQLYQKLIVPVADKLKEELIIVPDGILGYLPFEALLVEPALKPIRFRTHHYLLRDKQISYAYSATLLQEMRDKQHKNEASEGLLAFAPYYDGDTTQLAELFRYEDEDDKAPLKPLPNSGEEVYGIQQLIGGGQVYYHEEATEERFWKEAKNYRFLHLATHGKANDKTGDYSFLAFTQQKDSIENEFLFVRDLYNLQLNADMVVLSACETGIGELQRGEGIISLARGFTYAGAKSIFTTLWSVQDKSSKDLMLLFYKHLKAGMPKDKALRQAKLDYLDSLDSNLLAHPFHWSGFIGIGDMSPVKF